MERWSNSQFLAVDGVNLTFPHDRHVLLCSPPPCPGGLRGHPLGATANVTGFGLAHRQCRRRCRRVRECRSNGTRLATRGLPMPKIGADHTNAVPCRQGDRREGAHDSASVMRVQPSLKNWDDPERLSSYVRSWEQHKDKRETWGMQDENLISYRAVVLDRAIADRASINIENIEIAAQTIHWRKHTWNSGRLVDFHVENLGVSEISAWWPFDLIFSRLSHNRNIDRCEVRAGNHDGHCWKTFASEWRVRLFQTLWNCCRSRVSITRPFPRSRTPNMTR
jgi:hypothetical protein